MLVLRGPQAILLTHSKMEHWHANLITRVTKVLSINYMVFCQ